VNRDMENHFISKGYNEGLESRQKEIDRLQEIVKLAEIYVNDGRKIYLEACERHEKIKAAYRIKFSQMREVLEKIDQIASHWAYKSPEENFGLIVDIMASIHQYCSNGLKEAK